MLNNLYKEIEFGGQRDETIFNLGFFIGIATLLNFSFAVYLPGSIFILIIFTRNNVRSHLLLTFGALLPHLFLNCYYFVYDDLALLWDHFYWRAFVFHSSNLVSVKSLLILAAFPILYVLVSFFVLNKDARFTKYQAQILQATYLWFLVSLVQIWLTPEFRPQSLIVLIPSASFMISYYLLLIRRVRFASINTWILTLGILSGAYLARYEIIDLVSYRNMVLTDAPTTPVHKKVMLLGDNPSLYISNEVSPPFINWKLSKKILEEPDYYENVLMINSLFEKDPPDIIIDETHLMDGFFKRIPTLEEKYRRTSRGYVRR
jgi:hypothetical protein